MQVLLKIARQVRNRFEADYNDKSLEGFCYYASLDIAKEANKQGIKTKVVAGTFNRWSHTWIEHNGKIIDVTATQFGIRTKVFIVNANDDRYKRLGEVVNGND